MRNEMGQRQISRVQSSQSSFLPTFIPIRTEEEQIAYSNERLPSAIFPF